MFSWGEECGRGFSLKNPPVRGTTTAVDQIHFLNLDHGVRDLAAGAKVLTYVKTNGIAVFIRTNRSQDGRRVVGKQSEFEHLWNCIKMNRFNVHTEALSLLYYCFTDSVREV